jgi:FtsZ-interacting cell division protein ZipA
MKKSEKIGIGIVTVLAIILIAILLSGDSKKEKKQNFCNGLCYNSGSEMWSMMTEPRDDYNSYSTKNECVNACLLKK